MRRILDAHLDLAWNALGWDRDITLPLDDLNRLERDRDDHPARGRATTTLPEMRRGRVCACLATLLARTHPGRGTRPFADRLDFSSRDATYASARGQLAYYERLIDRGEIEILRSGTELGRFWAECEANGPVHESRVGVILAMEGCDPIVDPSMAEHWFELGLRCAGLVHYGHGAYAVGTGEEGPLTPEGRDLLREFERLGIILDVTHLSDRSFDEAMEVYSGPVVASHQNCRALVPAQRQFSDEQLRRVIERGGVIGLALDAWMLWPGWERGRTSREVVSIDALGDHLAHICDLAGSTDHVAIGSDLDGGFGTEQVPSGLDSIADLQKLAEVFERRGLSSDEIDRVFGGNWVRFFGEHLPS